MGTLTDLNDHESRAYCVAVTVLTAEKPSTSIKLLRGEELFVVVDGEPVVRPGYPGPDEVYCVGEEIAQGRWPVLLCRVRAAHAAKWTGLGPETASNMVARARRRLAETAPSSTQGG